MKTTQKQVEAIEMLKKHYNLKPNSTVFTSISHVSQSGMSRVIKCLVPTYNKHTKQWRVSDISFYVAEALGWRYNDKKGGVAVSGCGMDMGFHLVYSLSSTLWPNGTKKPHGTRNGEPDTDGGYALKHEWV